MRVFIKYNRNINEKLKTYTNKKTNSRYVSGKYNSLHYIHGRNNGPTNLKYKNSELLYESYCENNKYHRLDGPAWVNYEKNYVIYYINGKEYNSEFEYWLEIGNYKKFI